MAERQQPQRTVQLEFAFDRLRAAKLEQAYDILVPDQVRTAGGVRMKEASDEACPSAPGAPSRGGKVPTRSCGRALPVCACAFRRSGAKHVSPKKRCSSS